MKLSLVVKHGNSTVAILEGMETKVEMDPNAAAEIIAVEQALNRLTGLRWHIQDGQPNIHPCGHCPCVDYDGSKIDTYWTKCSCGHIAQDHN